MTILEKMTVALLALLATSQITASSSSKSESDRLNQFFAKVHQENLDMNPEFAAWVGDNTNNDKFNDGSEEYSKKNNERSITNLKKLRTFDYDKLDEQAQISYKIFELTRKRDIEGYKFRDHHYAISHNWGPHSSVPNFMMNLHTIENKKDALAYISRLKGFKQKFQWTIDRIKRGEKIGVIPPRFVFETVEEAAKNIIKGKPFDKSDKDSPLLADFKTKLSKLDLEKSESTKLIASATQALEEQVLSAYNNLIHYMRIMTPKAPKEGGATRIPNGREYYRTVLAYHTTTDFSPETVHKLGLSEVSRIHGEMREIMKKLKFKKDLLAFFGFLKNDPQFKYPATKAGKAQYLKDSEKIIAAMKMKLPELFGIFPKADLEVLAVEAYREKSSGIAFYESPTKDGKRPGRYYVNLYDMDAVSKFEMEALAYHEAIPGHHMQSAIALELSGIPEFRKYIWFTAYGEGWGLYSEYIPKEIGFYQDLYSDFGRLSLELWRAARLVVDTGIHSKGWTLDQANKYLSTNTPGAAGDIEKAVKRYTIWPGQATAYKIGMIKILELRKKSKLMLGEKFDIRRFHDEVLRYGNVPLALLEERINLWIKRSK